MGICWFCHWGWPKPIADIYDKAKADIDECLSIVPCEENGWETPEDPTSGEWALKWGPAHVVWEDENFDLAESCLKDCDEARFSHWHPPAMEIVKRSLRELVVVPDEMKSPMEEYDGDYPEMYPPPSDWIMVKR